MHRNTFMTYETMLRKVADLCRDSAESLRAHVDEANERYELTLREIADKQQHLVDTLSEYADDGPEKLLNTRLQYTDDVLAKPEQAPKTAGDALTSLQKHNETMERVFADYAAAAPAPDLSDPLQSLSDLFRAHARMMSETLAQARDL